MELQTYKVRDPSGALREIRGPSGASDAEVIAKAQELFGSPKQITPREPDALDNPNMATSGMSGGEQFAAGMGKAITDTGRGIKQLASYVIPGMDSNAATADVIESRKRDKALMNTGAGMAGDITGNVGMALAPGGLLKGAATVASKIPAAARVAQAMSSAGSTLMAPSSVKSALAVGGGMGLAQPAENASERVTNTILGAGLSGGAQAATRGLARVTAPQTRPDVKALIDEGVSLTPGQIMGGAAQRVEDGLTSVPIMGDSIKAAQKRGIVSFDRAAINRSLDPLGIKLPNGVEGRAAVEFAQDALGDAYNSLLPKLRGELTSAAQGAKPGLVDELNVIRQMGANLPDQQASQLNRILDNEVIGRFTPAGKASGETLKNIESKLGGMAKDFAKSDNYDVRTLGDALKETQAALRRMIDEVNPGYAKELSAINSGYANFKRIQKAAGAIGAPDGVFTPAQLQSAVKAGDWSKDKARFAVGDALMQDLSEAGKNVLSRTVPDSGTPFRLANMATLASGAVHPGIPAAAAAGAVAYSPAAQKVIEALLVKRPELMRQLAPKIAAAAPYAASASLPLSATINASQ